MAKGGKDEHRMLFDIRGRRKNVVKVVYGVLAALMGLSLLLVIGPAPLADIFGTKNAVESAAGQFEEQAERIEVKLVKDPEDPALLTSLTRAYVNAGNQLSEVNEATGQVSLTPEARQQLEQASSAWADYLAATDQPSANLAQIMSSALFALAQSATTGPDAEENITAAAEAQKIVADQRPSLGALTTYGLYAYYAFQFAAGEKAEAEAKQLAVSKSQREQIAAQFKETRERAEEFEAERQRQKKIEKELPQAANELPGGESGGNPLGNALSGSSLSE